MRSEQDVSAAHYELTLEPLPQSVGAARRWLAETLQAGGVDEAIGDTAALLVSELVTNAVLHARTDIHLSAALTGAELRVEVADDSPRMPRQRHFAATASTGRGMGLVASLATDFGSRPSTGGKVVWFVLALAPAPEGNAAEGVLGQPALRHRIRPDHTGTAVRLLGIPLLLFAAMQQQAEALLREYLLAVYGLADANPDLEVRLGAAADGLAKLTDAVTATDPAGVPLSGTGDANLWVPELDTHQFGVLKAVLDEATRLAEAELLLVAPSQPEIVALWTWSCDQVLSQSDRAAPQAWRAVSGAAAPALPQRIWDSRGLLATSGAIIAADDANRIVAISPAVTALLGWRADQLVGQRIVTIVPEELREAHIAGFTSYLVSGRPRILGQPVQLEALHADGHRVRIVIVVREHVLAGTGRIFTAELTAVEVNE